MVMDMAPDVRGILAASRKWPRKRIISGILNAYLDENDIHPSNLLIRKATRHSRIGDVDVIKNAYHGSITITVIEECFKRIVSSKNRQKYGVVYTPLFVTRHIIKKTISRTTRTFCDPSCGIGTFLIEGAKRMHTLRNEPIIRIIENRLYGADILAEHVELTKILLVLVAMEYGEYKRVIKFNILACNSLEFDWQRRYRRASSGFDAIATNPPYIRIQDLSPAYKSSMSSKWDSCVGSFNAYFAFIEWGYENLHKNGRLGYINSNSFITSFAASRLREWVQNTRFIRKIIDFKHIVLFDATSYTCIILADKKPKTSISYGYADSYDVASRLSKITYSANPYKYLRVKKWSLLLKDERKNIGRIESIGTPLGRMSVINSGIATLKDSVFLVPYSKKRLIEKQYLGRKYHVERSLTREVIKIPDVDKSSRKATPTHRIIFPYMKKSSGYVPIPEKTLRTRYPYCYAYLKAARNELDKRDKGKKKYYKWYSFGRIQGFNVTCPKLLTPTFSLEPSFILDDKHGRMFCNGYAVHSSRIPLGILQKILNSSVMRYYVTRTSVYVEGGYTCFQKNFIEKFGIPELTKKETRWMKSQQNQNKIDRMLVRKYGIILH